MCKCNETFFFDISVAFLPSGALIAGYIYIASLTVPRRLVFGFVVFGTRLKEAAVGVDAMTCTPLTTRTARILRNLAVWLLGAGAFLANSFAVANEAGDSATQVWLVSTRCAPACGPAQIDDPRIAYWMLGEQRQWLASDRATLLASSRPEVPTVLFVHGNWKDPQDAVSDGWQVLDQLRLQASGRPFRLVIWSWPSERSQRRPLEDVRSKAAWSDTQAYYLAGVVSQIKPDVPVTLIGYSLGSRAASGALQMLAGGQVAGMALPQPAGSARARLRAVLLAPAMDSDWLTPGHRNGEALGKVQQMMVTCNAEDPILKRYHWLYPGCYAEALGWMGPAGLAWPGPEQQKIEVVDVTCSVGRNHNFELYVNSAPAASRLAWYCFLADADPQSAATGQAASPAPKQAATEASESLARRN